MDVGIIVLFVFLGLAGGVLVIFKYNENEKKKRELIQDSFKSFNEKKNIEGEDLRNEPRIEIPKTMKVMVTLTDGKYFGLKAVVIDISKTGFSVKPDFPLRKLPVNEELNNVLINTAEGNFVIRKMKTVRYRHEPKKRLLAFEIVSIDADEREKFENFILFLKDFGRGEYLG